MGQALYRAYRPKSLAEVVGQEHVTTTLANALKSGRISHAYLLTGPRGVGKTSIARILAHEINGLPYNDEAHLDIIEIDAASNRRIDEIRDLRDKVSTAPASAKYKVYIIDEVHMLTKEAFNALLKTLEEPPAHVVFILATTEAHKLPETIISRTQRYSFRPVPHDQVVALLKSIAKKEKITIDDEALNLIAEHGEGSLRDSTSLLDQASNTTDKVGKADVERILGLAPAEYIAGLQQAVEVQDSTQVITNLTALYSSGYEAAMIAVQLGATLRGAVLSGMLTGSLGSGQALSLLKQLLDIPGSRQPKQLLELVLLQVSLQTSGQQVVTPGQSMAKTPVAPSVGMSDTPAASVVPDSHAASEQPAPAKAEPPRVVAKESPKVEQPIAPKVSPKNPPAVTASAPAPKSLGGLSEVDVRDLWQQTLDDIKKQYNTLYGMARMAVAELDGDKLTLNLKFAFHQKRINEVKNRQILGDVFSRLSGQRVEIYPVVADKPLVPATGKSEPDVSAISNIFGGAELLES